MTHTKIAFRQYSKPVVTVVDGVSILDGDFNVLNYSGPAACIQAAIDSIKTVGGTVYIRSGSYALETEVNFTGATKKITITGDGDATEITKSSAATGTRSVLDIGSIGTIPVYAESSTYLRFNINRQWSTLSPSPTPTVWPTCMAEFSGKLYVGYSDVISHVIKILSFDGSVWANVTPPTPARDFIESMVVFGGVLYVGVGNAPPSAGSQVYSYDGSTWTIHNFPGGGYGVSALAVHGGSLYAGSNSPGSTALVYKFNGGTSWTNTSLGWAATNPKVDSLVSDGTYLYASSSNPIGPAEIWKYNGATWSHVTAPWGAIYTDARLAVKDGLVYAGLGCSASVAKVYQLNLAGSAWTDISPSWDSNNYIAYSLCTIGSSLYIGTAHRAGASAELWAYADTTWSDVSPALASTNLVIQSMTSFGGVLYAGTEVATVLYSHVPAQWAYKPHRGEVLQVGGGFNAANKGAFTVRDATSQYIEVYPAVARAGLTEGPITLTNITNMVVKDSAFRVSEDIQNITIEKLSFARPATLGDGSHVFIDEGADNIIVQDCALGGAANTVGFDIQAVGRDKSTTQIDILRNAFSVDADCLDGKSAAIALDGLVSGVVIDQNISTGCRSCHILLQDYISSPALCGSDFRICRNSLSGSMTPSTAVATEGQGIYVYGMFSDIEIDKNDVVFTMSDNDVDTRGIDIRSGSTVVSPGVDVPVYISIKDNSIRLARSGTTTTYDRALNVDYSGAFSGTNFRATFVDVSGNDGIVTGSAETYVAELKYIKHFSICGNKTVGAGVTTVDYATYGVIAGNEFYGTAVAAGLTLNYLHVFNCSVGPNKITHNEIFSSVDPATSVDLNQQICKAWGFNVADNSTFTRFNLHCTHTNGTGQYDYTFDNKMVGTDYAIVATVVSGASDGIQVNAHTATGFTIITRNNVGSVADRPHSVAVFGPSSN